MNVLLLKSTYLDETGVGERRAGRGLSFIPDLREAPSRREFGITLRNVDSEC